ncbi:glycine betaine ABC transporter substrate-binding protein [cyanobacterium endosymbiont of Epithemia clementina EcSB]|uniref:glycine betaine ABC transporter substrate-binding protein n=1 Tax=cyanobacterium endosymbiont of Epithemia clementina EcSB TaxID=3034674 RepID=UPI00248003CE|nr:glycine betaine ABC transporter substrate-binding protein [cyanobacterium endosymbiont of Epithemia clementina EcSB]WGT67250.1 glycine betaine ABC transporter substrate-binding protein [cyanobacterium endosymbiont of Epithemia clementina EcSB]
MTDFFLISFSSELPQRIGEHLILVLISMGIAIFIGIPLGILITRYPKLANSIFFIVNAVQTVPSLAMFGFLITVPVIGGIGKKPAIFALILYALLPIIRNTYIGMIKVDKGVREAGKAMGMTDQQILLLIEIPLAVSMILAGVRVSMVICIGIATIAAAIGGGGLGVFIFRGISTLNNQLILLGAIPAALIALVADWGISSLEKSLIQYEKPRSKSKKSILIIWGIVVGILLSLFGIIYKQLFLESQGNETIVIGSKNFTESIILGEFLAQNIEIKTNLHVERKFNLGGTFICHEAVKNRQIDGYVEYSGTAFTAILNQRPISNPKQVYQRVKAAYNEKFNLEVMPSLGFKNTYAILIRQQDAEKYNVKTISEVSKYTPQWQAGFGHEFLAREDGYPGLAKTYNLNFNLPPNAVDLGLLYRILANKKVDLVAGNSTDGSIPILKLTILEDDKNYFPPYEAIPVFNKETFQQYPQIRTVIQQLAGQISTSAMQQLNYQVDDKQGTVAEVVHNFLIKKRLKP